MTPILFEADEVSFDHMGICGLPDAISGTCTIVKRGTNEINMTYPAEGSGASELKENRIILAVPAYGQTPQPFRIKRLTTALDGSIKVFAEHVTRDVKGVPVAPFTASSASDALAGLVSHAMIPTNITTYSDVTVNGAYDQKIPADLFMQLGGVDGSVRDCFRGGEYVFDFFQIRYLANPGRDNGVSIRYGINMTDFSMKKSIESVYTGVLAYWADQDENCIYGSVRYVSNYQNYPKQKIFILDVSSEFENRPTAAQLNARADSYITANNVGIPKIAYTCNLVDLAQTDQYKDVAPLQTVGVYDRVMVLIEELGVYAKAEVIQTDYDFINDESVSVKLGEFDDSLASEISRMGSSYTNTVASQIDNRVSGVAETASAASQTASAASQTASSALSLADQVKQRTDGYASSFTTSSLIANQLSLYDSGSTLRTLTGDQLKSILNGILATASVTVSIVKSVGSTAQLTAPQMTGYSFLAWIEATPVSWSGSVYIGNALSDNTTINLSYIDTPSTASGSVRCAALYIADL